MLFGQRSFCMLRKVSLITLSHRASTCNVRLSVSGENGSPSSGWPGSMNSQEVGARRAFPPSVVVEVKALACELPSRLGLPLSRFSLSDIRREVIAQGITAQISGTTLCRSAGASPRWAFTSTPFLTK